MEQRFAWREFHTSYSSYYRIVVYTCITVLHNLYIMYIQDIFLTAQNKAEINYAVHYAVRDAPASLRCTGVALPLYHSILPCPLLSKYPRNSVTNFGIQLRLQKQIYAVMINFTTFLTYIHTYFLYASIIFRVSHSLSCSDFSAISYMKNFTSCYFKTDYTNWRSDLYRMGRVENLIPRFNDILQLMKSATRLDSNLVSLCDM